MTRYEQLERLEKASQPPASQSAGDPRPGATVANYEIIAEVVELIIGMNTGERAKVAQEIAEHDWELADTLASMLLDAVYDCQAVWGLVTGGKMARMIRSVLTEEPVAVGDYVEEMDD